MDLNHLIDILPNIFDYVQPFDDIELSQIGCVVPNVEHRIIHQNHEAPLDPPPPPPPPSSSSSATHKKKAPRHVHLKSSLKRKAAALIVNFGETVEDEAELNPEESKKVKKLIHRNIERQRRHEMATLYASLRSHLPHEFVKGKRSISDHVQQAGNYIKHLQKKVEELREKKFELINSEVSGSSGSTAAVVDSMPAARPSSIMRDSVILVRPSCTKAVEVVVNTPLQQGLPISKVIKTLIGEGLCIKKCNTAKINQRLIYTLESEVIGAGKSIDIPELQNWLIEKSMNF